MVEGDGDGGDDGDDGGDDSDGVDSCEDDNFGYSYSQHYYDGDMETKRQSL